MAKINIRVTTRIGRTRNFSYIRENNSSALTLITDEERYFLMTLKSMQNNNISKANSYAVMLCEGPQINKFLLAMEGIAIITGDIKKLTQACLKLVLENG